MEDHIYIEPAHEHRPGFALWGLDQTPPLHTASATGWNVPINLYAACPPELLAGAYVDGYPYDHEQNQPRPESTMNDIRDALAQQLADQLDIPVSVMNPESPRPAPTRTRRKRTSKKPVQMTLDLDVRDE